MGAHSKIDAVSVIEDFGEEVVAAQAWYFRRKETLTVIVQAILQVLNYLAAQEGQYSPEIMTAISVALFVVQGIFTAMTKGAVTPSGVAAIAAAAEAKTPPAPSQLPVYAGLESPASPKEE